MSEVDDIAELLAGIRLLRGVQTLVCGCEISNMCGCEISNMGWEHFTRPWLVWQRCIPTCYNGVKVAGYLNDENERTRT